MRTVNDDINLDRNMPDPTSPIEAYAPGNGVEKRVAQFYATHQHQPYSLPEVSSQLEGQDDTSQLHYSEDTVAEAMQTLEEHGLLVNLGSKAANEFPDPAFTWNNAAQLLEAKEPEQGLPFSLALIPHTVIAKSILHLYRNNPDQDYSLEEIKDHAWETYEEMDVELDDQDLALGIDQQARQVRSKLNDQEVISTSQPVMPPLSHKWNVNYQVVEPNSKGE